MEKEKGRNVVSGVFILSLAGILVKICGFLYKVPLNAALGDEMANVNAAYAVYTVLYTLSTAGIPAGIAVIVSELRAKGGSGAILRPALRLLATVGLFGTVLLFAVARPVSLWNSGGDTFLCILAIAPSLFFVCLSSVYRGVFQGEGRMVPIAVSELFEAFGKMGLGLFFAFFAGRQLGLPPRETAALSVVGITAGIAAGSVFLAVIGRRLPKTGSAFPHFGRKLLALSLPIMAASLMLNLSSLLDAQWMRPLLAAYTGSDAAAKAIYSDYSTGAVTLFNLPMVLVHPIAVAAVPVIAARRARGETEGVSRAVGNGVRMAALVSMPCALVFAVLGGPILAFVFRTDADMATNAGGLLTLLSPSVFLAAMLTVTNAALQACRLQNRPVRSVIPALLCKTAASFLLIPRVGAIGAPIGTLLFYAVAVACNLRYLAKDAGFRISFSRHFVRPLGASALAAVSAFGVYHATVPFFGVNALFPAGAAALVVFLPASLFFGCVTEEDLRLLPRAGGLVSFLSRRHWLRDAG